MQRFSAKGGIFKFLRAQLVSQIATWVDNLSAFGLKKLMDFSGIKFLSFFSYRIEAYVGATMVGQIFGGIVNCIINYRWTFKARSVKKKYMIIKFVLVWIGSLILNTIGTYQLTEALRRVNWLSDKLGYRFDDIFIVAKLCVALFVGILWNYNMQCYFVYKNVDIKHLFQKRNR
jgi:putative flippase GtrA